MPIQRYLVLALLVGAWRPMRSQARPSHAFVDVTVLSMTRHGIDEHQTVLISGDAVVSVGPHSQVQIPAGVVRIDGRGRFLMPGLGDAHAHLSSQGGGPGLAELALEIFPLYGVTMIRSMYTEPHHRALLDRSHGRAWPRTQLVAPALSGQTAPTPQAARDSLRAYRALGYRVAKILPGVSRQVFDAIVAEARELDMPVTGHVPGSVGLSHTLSSGLASLEHLDGMLEGLTAPGLDAASRSGFFGFGLLDHLDESLLPDLVRQVRASGVVVVPTEVEMERYTSPESGAALAGRPEMRLVPSRLVAMWTQQKDGFARATGVTAQRHARYRAVRHRIIRALHDAGVPIAAGSDAFNLFGVPGSTLAEELATYVEAGLSRHDALRAATVDVARLLQLPGVTGTVTPGSAADLVLLEGNPLQDLRWLSRPVGVMLRGAWMDRPMIDARLDSLMASRDAR